jgi:hypothetical protein
MLLALNLNRHHGNLWKLLGTESEVYSIKTFSILARNCFVLHHQNLRQQLTLHDFPYYFLIFSLTFPYQLSLSPSSIFKASMRQSIIVSFTLAVTTLPTFGFAAPANFNDKRGITLVERQDVTVIGLSNVSPDVICGLSATDPNTFQNSGAQRFLNDFLVANGESGLRSRNTRVKVADSDFRRLVAKYGPADNWEWQPAICIRLQAAWWPNMCPPYNAMHFLHSPRT